MPRLHCLAVCPFRSALERMAHCCCSRAILPLLQVGGSTVSKAIVAASGVSEARLRWVMGEGGEERKLALCSASRCASTHASQQAGTSFYWRCRELYQQLGDAGDVAQACKRTQASCLM